MSENSIKDREKRVIKENKAPKKSILSIHPRYLQAEPPLSASNVMTKNLTVPEVNIPIPKRCPEPKPKPPCRSHPCRSQPCQGSSCQWGPTCQRDGGCLGDYLQPLHSAHRHYGHHGFSCVRRTIPQPKRCGPHASCHDDRSNCVDYTNLVARRDGNPYQFPRRRYHLTGNLRGGKGGIWI